MQTRIETIAGWANFPRIESSVLEPANLEETRDGVLSHDQILARGNGRSYGDASLAPRVLSTLQMNRVLHFDKDAGVLECESGVLLSDLLPLIVPVGWFFHVTPGTIQITIGGAIASDVHGKNHFTAGCFSNHLLSFELMTANGAVVHCTKTENSDLFWQTCGGMGWTGIILSARFSLMRLPSTRIQQLTVKAPSLKALFRAFESNSHWPYAAAWVDCTHARWRGVAFFGAHEPAKGEHPSSFSYEPPKPHSIPFYAPSGLLNPWSIRAYNMFVYHKNRSGESSVGIPQYFFPLDALLHWNRLYGRRGLIQYQFCLPETQAFEGMSKVLDTIRASHETPFLTVFKRHGDRPAEAIHSFPIRGYSLALDFPRTRGMIDLVKKLDEIVWAHQGKIYLTKDACSAPGMGRVDPKAFGEEKFASLLKERISRPV